MRFVRLLTLLLVACTSLTALAQRNFDNVQIQTIEVADGLFMLVGSGGNIGLSVGADGAFLIDDQFAPLSDRIMAAVREAGGGDVRFVINTHWHGDHTGGNEPFGEAGAMLVAHENVRRRMDPGTFTDVMGNSEQAPAIALPVVTFQQGATFWWNGERIEAEHVPGAHTDGDSVVWFHEANVVHMGDNFFVGSLPYIDVDSGGNIDGMIAAAEVVLAGVDEQTRIIPGHGRLAGAADLREFHAMLVELRDRVQARVDAGDALEDIDAEGLLGEYMEFSNNFMTPDRFVGIVYRCLTE